MCVTFARVVRYGLLGRSLGHSFSRKYFTDKFAREGLADHDYENYELDSLEELPRLLASEPALRGFNVTIPYKRQILPYLDGLDPVAARVGAVNTVVRSADGALTGYNTDVVGFAQTLDAHADSPALREVRERRFALVLGTGGASDAVLEVLRQRQHPARRVSRSPAGDELGYPQLEGLEWRVPRLLVNTTPVGTAPDLEAAPPIPLDRLGPEHLVVDLIYNPPQTALLRAAAERGAQTANGLRMLHGQADAAWALWQRDRAPQT